MKNKYDLLIVGGGPAGSLCAKTSAEKGLNVLMIEKRQEIGVPIRCAEGVGKKSLEKFIKPDKRWISAESKGANIFSPDGTCVSMSEEMAGGEVGYVLERKIFDRILAYNAAEAGAEVLVKTAATGLLRSDGFVKGAKIRHLGNKKDVYADIVVGADGVESKVGRWAGIDTTLKLADIETCVQVLMANIDIDQECNEFYLGNEIAPGGYAWIFPKGDLRANVGLGIAGDRSGKTRVYDYLMEFIKRFPEGQILEMVFGGVPVSAPMEKTVDNGIILAGDAARHSDPITGGGIINAMKAGTYAGEVATQAISSGNVSSDSLKEYERLCWEEIGKTNRAMYNVKEIVMKFTDEELNSLAHSLEGIRIEELSATGLLMKLVDNNPKLLGALQEFFK